MTIPINPIKVFVRQEYLYDMDANYKDKYSTGQIVGITAYKGQTLTFEILVEGKYMYSNMPITSFCSQERTSILSFKSLANVNCPRHKIDVYRLNLEKVYVGCYFKGTNQWKFGEYVLTVNFYTDNELLNLIKLDGGEYALVPNHKINWNADSELSDYKKSHQNWSL